MKVFEERILFYVPRMEIEIILDIDSGFFAVIEAVTPERRSDWR
jgi:hypothetical protein